MYSIKVTLTQDTIKNYRLYTGICAAVRNIGGNDFEFITTNPLALEHALVQDDTVRAWDDARIYHG